jgi:hypothetical protein
MSEFGQTLPALPQIYWTQAQFSFTKAGLTSHMCRALATVGMEPLQQWWPYDALDPANAEIVLQQGVNTTSTYIFPFDFPDASTFSINNELWRPFICVVAYYGNLATATGSNNQNDYFRVDLGIRRDGAITMADTRGRYRQFTAAHFGWGNQGDAVTLTGGGGLGDNSRGCFVFKPDWKPWASGAFVDNSLLNVRNFFVYLGPAGLFVYLGTGATRDLFGSIMAAGFAFGGARLPDRAITPDPNLNRICPIVHLPMLETNAQVYNSGNGFLRTIMPCMQHDLVSTLNWTNADLWNLENSEIPFYPARNPNTLSSPRRLSSGQGAHILGRVVTIPKEQFAATSILMGPVNPRITTSDTRPAFSEVFACPRFRFADVTAPLGDYEDPDTLENWRIVPHPAANMQVALYSENAVVASTLSVGNKTLVEVKSYDLTSTTQTGTGAFPIATPVTVVSVPSGMNALVSHVTISANVGTSRWQSPAATDLLTLDMTAFTNNDNLDLNWTMTPPGTDPMDSIYELQFDCRVRGGAEDTNNLQALNQVNGVFLNVAMFDGTTSRTLIATAGANASHYAFDYKTYTVQIVRDIAQTTGPITFRLRGARTNASDATVIEIKVIRINRYRYV